MMSIRFELKFKRIYFRSLLSLALKTKSVRNYFRLMCCQVFREHQEHLDNNFF